MKRKLKQWWSTISPISTNQTSTSHLKSLNKKKEHEIWSWKSRSLFGTGINMWQIKPITAIQLSRKPALIRFQVLKRPQIITKINYNTCQDADRVRVMVFNTTFNNISVISWWSVFLVEETRVPRENHRPVANHWQTLSHNVVSNAPHRDGIRTHNISDDRHLLHR